MKINIDVTDWNKDYTDAELNLEDKAAIFDAMFSQDLSAIEMTRLYLIARERGVTDETFLPDNKSLLLSGGGGAMNMAIAQITKKIQTPAGEYKVREVVLPVREKKSDAELELEIESKLGDGVSAFRSSVQASGAIEFEMREEPHNALSGSELARDRAVKFLLKRVPGYIWNRLLIIYDSGGDVSAALDELRTKIDEMEAKFMEK